MKRLALSSEQIAGLAIGLLGVIVTLRWTFMSETVGMLIPGSEQMGIVSPLMFIAAGVCCWLTLHCGTRLRTRLWAVCVGALIVVPALVLAEHVFDVNLGIDVVRVPTLPTRAAPHPGRMAPNTALAFLLAGCAFWLLHRVRRSRLQDGALAGCAALVMALGLSALFGYFLKLEALYRVAAFNGMVPPTAAGLCILGAGLWSMRASLRPRSGIDAADYERRITWRALAVVALVALSAGAAGFAAMRESYEKSIADNTLLTATTTAAALGNTLETSLWFARNLATRSAVRERLLALDQDPDESAERARLAAIGRSFAPAGVTAIQFYNTEGELMASVGTFTRGAAVSRQPLGKPGQAAELVWNGNYSLYTETDVREGGRLVGRIAAEQRLPIIDQLLADIRARSASSDVLLCNLDQTDAFCAPSRFYPAPFRIPMYRPDGRINLPINHALLGQSGVAVTEDLRGIPVFAGYTPVRDFGLGVVIKSDVKTLYTPLRERTNALVIALVVLIVLGASTLQIQVRPLLTQLVNEQRRTRVILDNSNDAFIGLGSDGLVTDWNGAAERTFGWSALEAIGRDLAELIIPPDQRSAHIAGFKRFTRTGTGPVVNQRLEVTALHRDGHAIPIELSIAAYHNGNGFVANAFARDIAERHRLAAEIDARATELGLERDRAQAANRAKGEFVANMSHELRTPMNAVLGMTYLLAHTGVNPEQKKYLEMIRSSGQSLLGIMNDILDFSKVEAGRMELAESPFHLGDVLGAVATIMSVNAGDKDLELAIGVDPGLPQELVGDALRVQQVLINLVGNAIKFTESGEVSVVVDSVPPPAPAPGVVFLRILVRDTGVGIGKEQQARLFSPFTQGDSSTTRRFGGTGLGLTISKHLTELMGGSIALDSEEGKGSTFQILLPLRVADDQHDARRNAAALGPLRILVADDNATSRACLADTIAAWHWEADSAGSGAEALLLASQANAAGRPYDAVLLDWNMPLMDGMATARELRRLAPGAQQPLILMVNAYGRGKLIDAPDARQVDAFLSKPVTGSSLFDSLHDVLTRRSRAKGQLPFVTPATPLRRLDGVRLLLAEDNELNQAVARGILERVGARIDIVGNGQLALERLRAEPGAYDLVLMDIQMPVMDGFEATRAIRTALSLRLPIVAMTAGVTENERAACHACGMDDLIAKPVEVDDMLTTIARHLPAGSLPVVQGAVPAAALPEPASLAATAQLPVLRLEPLVNIARGNPAHLASIAKLVRRMIDDGSLQFEQARSLWRAGAPLDSAKVLHSLRGGVGSVGAKRMAAASLALEQVLKQNDPPADDIERQFDAVGQELDAAVSVAQAWLDLNAASAAEPSSSS